MKISHGHWKGWSVRLEYTDGKKKIDGLYCPDEHAPSYISAQRTGKTPLHVAYAEVKFYEHPFQIIVERDGTQSSQKEVQLNCIIDGRQLSSGQVSYGDGKGSTVFDTWVDEGCGTYHDKNYKFAPILFIPDGPIPAEALYYGSIIVTLEEITARTTPTAPKILCTGNKPLGLLDKKLEHQTTDCYVDGNTVRASQPGPISYISLNKSIPKATVVFKYGSTNTLKKNGIIPKTPTAIASRPTTRYGGTKFKQSATPLTVIYNPDTPRKRHRTNSDKGNDSDSSSSSWSKV
ncbi:hypothetical protein Q8F55_006030 [Vanrija albida]|uniref:Uncharacterized protein n=1 Tax=Vanrija albida TaxID=181172 RepID=A0ABR3Q367_9TREE